MNMMSRKIEQRVTVDYFYKSKLLTFLFLRLDFTVPIIPEFLYDIKHPNATLSEHLEGSAPRRTTVVTTALPTTTTTEMAMSTTPKCPCAPNISVPTGLVLRQPTTPAMDLGKVLLVIDHRINQLILYTEGTSWYKLL